MKQVLSSPIDDFLTIKKDDNKEAFAVDTEGNVRFLVDGKMKVVKDKKDLALAFVGSINAMMVGGDITNVENEDQAIKTAITAMRQILAKHDKLKVKQTK